MTGDGPVSSYDDRGHSLAAIGNTDIQRNDRIEKERQDEKSSGTYLYNERDLRSEHDSLS